MKKIVLVITAGMLLGGCASVYHGTTQEVTVTTHPAGLTASMDGKQCVTPCTLQEVKRKTAQITLTTPEGQPYFFDVDKDFNVGAAVLGNWWNYVAPGVVIDMANGSAWTIKPVNIRLDQHAATK
jgi:uncharacterized protein YceK